MKKYCPLFILLLLLESCTIKSDYKDALKEEFEHEISEARNNTNGKMSLPHSLRALQIATQLGDKEEQAASCREISHSYGHTSQLDSSLKYALLAANIYNEIKEYKDVAMMYNKIGTLYFNQGDTILSIKYMEEALAIHREIRKAIYIGEDLGNLGEAYRMMGMPEKAIGYQREALQYIDKSEHISQYAYTIGNLGLAYAAVGQQDSARFYIEKSKILLHGLGDNYPITVYLTEGAKISLRNGLYEDAIEQVTQSLKLAEKENFKQQTADCYLLLSEIQQKNGDYKAAFEAYLKSQQLKDSLTNIDLVRKMERQRVDFEVSQREATIQNLERINKLRTGIILILTVGLLLISAIFIYNRKLNQRLKRANTLLEEKGAELEIKNVTINKALAEKEVLLSEMHHRVKNNLQIISSLLNMQAQQVDDEQAKLAFENSQRRLLTIAGVHQLLYQSENMAAINFHDYVCQMMDDISQAYASSSKQIKHELHIDDIYFNIEQAMPLGLIINELITNSYKYAFTGRSEGAISIGLTELHTGGKYELVYTDNGIGFPADLSLKETKSLGMRLIKILCKQLHAETLSSSDNGFEFKMSFKKPDT